MTLISHGPLCPVNSSSKMLLTSFFPSCPSPWPHPTKDAGISHRTTAMASWLVPLIGCLTPLILYMAAQLLFLETGHILSFTSSGIFRSSSRTKGRSLTSCLDLRTSLVLPNPQLYPSHSLHANPVLLPSFKCYRGPLLIFPAMTSERCVDALLWWWFSNENRR